MLQQSEISDMVQNYFQHLPIPSEPKGLYDPIKYTLEEGGKRLRPVLVVAACNIFSDEVLESLSAAAAVEVFHNFTLIHDDIMDNAPIRRGRPSVYKKWDISTGILSGDATMIFSYMLLGNTRREILPEVLSQFNSMALEVCEGQQLDMDFEKYAVVEMSQYLSMIELKTAALIARALTIGAIIGGAGERDREAIYRFGMNLGVAFQLQDDFLDTYGDEASLGKSIGGDILEGKKSFLAVHACRRGFGEEIARIVAGDDADSVKIERVRAIYDDTGLRKVALDAIGHYTSEALSELTKIDVDVRRREVMEGVARGLLNRER